MTNNIASTLQNLGITTIYEVLHKNKSLFTIKLQQNVSHCIHHVTLMSKSHQCRDVLLSTINHGKSNIIQGASTPLALLRRTRTGIRRLPLDRKCGLLWLRKLYNFTAKK